MISAHFICSIPRLYYMYHNTHWRVSTWECIMKNNASGFIAVWGYMWFLIKFGIVVFKTYLPLGIYKETHLNFIIEEKCVSKGKKLPRVVFKSRKKTIFCNSYWPLSYTKLNSNSLDYLYRFTVCRQTDTKPATQHKHKPQLRTPSDHKCLVVLPWVVNRSSFHLILFLISLLFIGWLG